MQIPFGLVPVAMVEVPLSAPVLVFLAKVDTLEVLKLAE